MQFRSFSSHFTQLSLIVIALFVMSCKEDNKKSVNSTTIEKQTISKAKEPLQEVVLPNVKYWRNNEINLIQSSELYSEDTIYKMSREILTKPSYTAISNLKIFNGSDYELSVQVKKGEIGTRFGMRIQSIYPNKIDAVFDLDKGKVVGYTHKGDFYNLHANISLLSDDWYLCSIRGEVLYDKISLVFGPTTKTLSVSSWESKSQIESDIYIIPSSLRLLEY
jgi:hypothetical protein